MTLALGVVGEPAPTHSLSILLQDGAALSGQFPGQGQAGQTTVLPSHLPLVSSSVLEIEINVVSRAAGHGGSAWPF